MDFLVMGLFQCRLQERYKGKKEIALKLEDAAKAHKSIIGCILVELLLNLAG